jgi:hypothetical protein
MLRAEWLRREAQWRSGSSSGGGSRYPSIDALLRPALQSAVAELGVSELAVAVADLVGLDTAARQARFRSGSIMIDARVGWVATNLVWARLLDQPAPGRVVITGEGRELLAEAVPLTRALLRQRYPAYASWLATQGGALPDAELDGVEGPTAWMVRAGRGGVYGPAFVERSEVVIGWGAIGDASGLAREDLLDRVTRCFPDVHKNQRGQAANALYRLVQVMREEDLIVTPEPGSRTILLGRVSGRYRFLEEPIAGALRHARPVRWFARIPREELSFGARRSLGSLLALSKPGHEVELLQLAEAHALDGTPAPRAPTSRAIGPRPAHTRVEIPKSAIVAERATLAEFQTSPRRMTQLLGQLETGELALPDFQRSFVWAAEATRELIVSMIRSFPAGALLFLQGGAETFRAREAEGAPALHSTPSTLVLDGQQRLTSLYQALHGVGQSRFFLDIGALISGVDINEAVCVFPVDRVGALEGLEAQADALMMPLSAARDGGASRWRDDVVDQRADDDPASVRRLLRGVEQAYIDPLVHYSFPVTVLPASVELEAVCTIFETLNRTGKPLTPFELISARAFAGGLSLRDYWSAALIEHPVLDDFEVDPLYVLQGIALRLGSSCQRKVVLSLDPDDIAALWEEAVRDMASALRLLRDECGVLIGKWLPYRPMLIPLSAAWREIENAAGPVQGAMRAKLKQWFWCANFTGEYESSSASLAERDASVLKAWLAGGLAPPVVAGFDWDASRWRSVTSRQQGLYRATVALSLTSNPLDFHTAAPLNHERIRAGKIDDHHVFPQGYLKDIGRASETDSVLNHALIDRSTNIRILKRAPSSYLREIRDEIGGDLDRILASHHLPTGEHNPLGNDDYDGFLAWRQERLHDELLARTGTRPERTKPVDPTRSRLDSRIEQIELVLRDLINDRLNGDPNLLPRHIADPAAERIRNELRKQPGRVDRQRLSLPVTLEYLDLRELKDTIVSKPLWPTFQDVFVSREALGGRFNQLAGLRNAIRHSRSINHVTLKDGEAAIGWFREIFDGLHHKPGAGSTAGSPTQT